MYVQSQTYAAKRKYNVRFKPDGGNNGMKRPNFSAMVNAAISHSMEERVVKMPMVRIQLLNIDREGKITR